MNPYSRNKETIQTTYNRRRFLHRFYSRNKESIKTNKIQSFLKSLNCSLFGQTPQNDVISRLLLFHYWGCMHIKLFFERVILVTHFSASLGETFLNLFELCLNSSSSLCFLYGQPSLKFLYLLFYFSTC